MTEANLERSAPARVVENVHLEAADDAPNVRVNLLSVLIALAVLVGLVALIFFALPALLGTPAVNVQIRTP